MWWISNETSFCSLQICSFSMICWDKFCAKMGFSRIPENVFHTLTFLDGWPGIIAACMICNHKTRKRSFQQSNTLAFIAALSLKLVYRWLFN
mmetsp:Transcript_19756/g.22737  ORF Transcript_19756/g.22737 Transcript_19756/m.22737 type:complete len:92 (+) Transcript_19756:65-340(+)